MATSPASASVQKFMNPNTTGVSAAASPFLNKKSNLQTSEGLYNVAVQSGLKDRADAVLASQTGEDTKKIFSGGFISDAFDVLNALQYGTVGVLKGKSFLEGVQTRSSFSDKDALGDKGIPGMIAGIALDIAFDPLTYIAPATVVNKIPFATKLLKGAKEAIVGRPVLKAVAETAESAASKTTRLYEAPEGGTKLGRYLAEKVSYNMSMGDPVFRETWERGVRSVATQTKLVTDMVKDVSKITPESAAKIITKDATGRFQRVKLDELKGVLKPEEFETVARVFTKLDNLGKEAVDLGLLSKDKWEDNLGTYLKNAYTEYEQANEKNIFGRLKQAIKGQKARVQGLTPEKMQELGQIDNPSYLLWKSTFDITKDVENAKMFREIRKRFGTDTAQEGFAQLPTGVRLGELSGKYVPQQMADYLTEIIAPAPDTMGKQLVAAFKFAKVIMNPATHARNIISNKLLNYWKLGMNPLDPRVMKIDLDAMKEIAKGSGKWIDEATPLGWNLDTFASAEMKGLLDSPEAMSWGGKAGSAWAKTKNYLGNIYQAEENQAKLSAYIYQRTVKKLEPERAWKTAEAATFNYAQVTPFVRKLRTSLFGFPFITFTVKSTPAVIETALKNPERISVIGKMRQAIEEQADLQETERERASAPPWVKNGFYVKIPMKDKEGRSVYFDMTYILPFGDIVSGQFFERGSNIKTGLPESLPAAGLRKSPFISLVSELGKNSDFYGNKIWKESDTSEKQLGDLMRHLSKTMLPPLVSDQIPGGYNDRGERQQRGIVGALKPQERQDQQRTIMEELLRNIGAKVQPIDADIQETYQEWNKRKGLQNMLLENYEQSGIKNFSRIYEEKE